MKAVLVAGTGLIDASIWEQYGWEPNPNDPEAQSLIEAAGRECYQSWTRPNAATATNGGYIRNILSQRHFSVLEHGVATIRFSGVSRSFTHELVRHRHFSYSQLSQRYVPEGEATMVEPEVIANNPELHEKFVEASENALRSYSELLEGLEAIYADEPDRTARRKSARQAARSVLPNATETRIIVTGNYRAWRHFLHMRGSIFAEPEIRGVAVEVAHILKGLAPDVFSDVKIHDDGTVTVGFHEEDF